MMTLREQIKLVNTALSNTMDLYRLWAKKCNINYNTLLVLYTLNDCGICTQKQICEWWALPKQTVHGILLELEKSGYLKIETNAENKRERLISFTESGNCFSESILSRLYEMEERAMAQLSPEQRKQLISCNTDYYRRLKEAIEHGE